MKLQDNITNESNHITLYSGVSNSPSITTLNSHDNMKGKIIRYPSGANFIWCDLCLVYEYYAPADFDIAYDYGHCLCSGLVYAYVVYEFGLIKKMASAVSLPIIVEAESQFYMKLSYRIFALSGYAYTVDGADAYIENNKRPSNIKVIHITTLSVQLAVAQARDDIGSILSYTENYEASK